MRKRTIVFAILILSFSHSVVYAQKSDIEKWHSLTNGDITLEFTARDSTIAPILLQYTVNGYKTVESFFGESFSQKFAVRVFPNRETLTAYWRKAWNIPGLQTACWMVASGTAKELTMLSPTVWKTEACEHDFADSTRTQNLITHELTHVFHGQMNPRPDFEGLDDIGWFLEGLAVHVSGQLNEGYLASPKEAIEKNLAPEALENAWSGKYRYGVSGSLVQYIDKTYGREKVKQMLKGVSESELLGMLNLSEKTLLEQWREFVLSGN